MEQQWPPAPVCKDRVLEIGKLNLVISGGKLSGSQPFYAKMLDPTITIFITLLPLLLYLAVFVCVVWANRRVMSVAFFWPLARFYASNMIPGAAVITVYAVAFRLTPPRRYLMKSFTIERSPMVFRTMRGRRFWIRSAIARFLECPEGHIVHF
ncbi:MAG: hypothetical protein JWQ02_483 [Capsulimonas sp.]|nr:hypothetical protein [Capsulimonas sp.]